MSSKSKRLGSLADIFQTETLEGTIRKIKLTKIIPSENQPRIDRMKGVEELAKSLEADGLLQPILVTKDEGDNYRIIAGERRFHAARLLGWSEIECKILNRDARETYKLAIIENLQRENLSAYEEIEAIGLLKDKFNYTDSEIGNIFGKSRNYMSELLSIRSMSKEELKVCQDSGIESKNLLVQAAIASKNGLLDDFIEKFRKGEVRTVKEAKEFNRSSDNLFKKKEGKQEVNSPISYEIQQDNNQVIIVFEDSTTAEQAFHFLKKQLENFKSKKL